MPDKIRLLADLIRFDTTSRHSNLELIEYVADYLSDLGVESLRVESEDGRKANLYATLGPADRPGIALSGHTDVVPVDGQEWDSDPFEMHHRDGRVYGRGSADMKGFIATCLAMAPELAARDLAAPIHLVLSYDEEVGCLGVRRLLDMLKDAPIKPRGCIIGEPTEMRVIRGHKGKLSVQCRVRGFECHSSLSHQGVNAVEYAAMAIARLRARAAEFRENGPFDQGYDPPYTTVHTGVIQGGTALNIVPKDCRFEFEYRNLPEDDSNAELAAFKAYVENAFVPEMTAKVSGTGFSFETQSEFPPLDTDENHEMVALAKKITGANRAGKVAFGTEAGLFQDAGIPAIICGPGSIEQAHKPNEFVTLDQLDRCEMFIRKLGDELA